MTRGYYLTAEPVGTCSCHGCTCEGCDECQDSGEPTLRDWQPADDFDPWGDLL